MTVTWDLNLYFSQDTSSYKQLDLNVFDILNANRLQSCQHVSCNRKKYFLSTLIDTTTRRMFQITTDSVVPWALILAFWRIVVKHSIVCISYCEDQKVWWRYVLEVWRQASVHNTVICYGASRCLWQPVHARDQTPLLPSQTCYLIFSSTSVPNPEGSVPLFVYNSPNCNPSNATPFITIPLFSCPSILQISWFVHYSTSPTPPKERNLHMCNTASDNHIVFLLQTQDVMTSSKMFHSQHSKQIFPEKKTGLYLTVRHVSAWGAIFKVSIQDSTRKYLHSHLYKVRGNCALEQAMKARWGSRGIALLFLQARR
jgi:hypothetical protein